MAGLLKEIVNNTDIALFSLQNRFTAYKSKEYIARYRGKYKIVTERLTLIIVCTAHCKWLANSPFIGPVDLLVGAKLGER